jgi:hypothetical protein
LRGVGVNVEDSGVIWVETDLVFTILCFWCLARLPK